MSLKSKCIKAILKNQVHELLFEGDKGQKWFWEQRKLIFSSISSIQSIKIYYFGFNIPISDDSYRMSSHWPSC